MLMRMAVKSPKSSVDSSSSSTSSMEDGSSSSSSCCRRDANCRCKTCLDSLNATLDLLPIRSSLTKLSSSKPSPPQTPLTLHSSTISTPTSQTSRLMLSPPLNSSLRTDFRHKINRKTIEFEYGFILMKCVLILCFILIGKVGFYFVDSTVMKTKLSPEIVRNLSDNSLGFQDVKEKLRFLNIQLHNLVPETSSTNLNWEIVQDGLILRSRLHLYKSGLEEVSIWGWPLQTAGLLINEYASSSFTILSGRVTEWSNGEVSCSIRKANASWEQGKWSSAVWRLDENTWILEYKRSFVFDDTRPFSSTMEFLKFKMMKGFQWMKQLWKLSDDNHISPT